MGRKNNNTLYINVANDLLDSLFENIDTLLSLDLKKRLDRDWLRHNMFNKTWICPREFKSYIK